jgi:hypothetical protein
MTRLVNKALITMSFNGGGSIDIDWTLMMGFFIKLRLIIKNLIGLDTTKTSD